MYKNQADQKVSTKDNNLKTKFNNRNQVDDKIVWGLCGGFLSCH